MTKQSSELVSRHWRTYYSLDCHASLRLLAMTKRTKFLECAFLEYQKTTSPFGYSSTGGELAIF